MQAPKHPLKELRTKKDLTQLDLSCLLGFSAAHISHFETGRTPLAGKTLRAVSELFDIDPEALENYLAAYQAAKHQYVTEKLKRK